MRHGMRRSSGVALPLFIILSLSGCAGGAGVSGHPFGDITLPETFLPYSDRWAFIKSRNVTAARLVYMTELDAEAAVNAVRGALEKDGWIAGALNRSASREGFKMVSLDLEKGKDTCRATVIEGTHATHVDLAVARLTVQ